MSQAMTFKNYVFDPFCLRNIFFVKVNIYIFYSK